MGGFWCGGGAGGKIFEEPGLNLSPGSGRCEAACQPERKYVRCARVGKGGGTLPVRAGGGKSEHRRARCRVTLVSFEVWDTRGR
jgi:hypothetical protein